jgi:uncharacterized protein with HEPN domain
MLHNTPTLLEDIRRATEFIQQFTASRSLAEYAAEHLLRSAVERQFIIIGEALSRLEKLDAANASQITDYRKIIGFRNVLVHGYEMIDDQIVWNTVQDHLPILKHQVESLLAGFGPP